MNTEKFEMIAKTFQGLEDVLAQEIIAIGGEEVEQGKRMVSFIGDKEMMYKANFHLRTALRILKPIKTFTASNTDEVYDFIKTVKWEDYIAPDQTFAIDSVVFSDNFRHSKFVTYRAKDAIVDYFMEKTGKRPSVRITNADLSLNLHIAGHTCTLSLDSSGESLHKRGYRVDQTEAPLNEVLAAGMILKTGWNGERNFLDPMCGSGTLLIEAAMIATNTPPGVYRQGFAFEKWKNYDAEMFDRLYNDETGEREFDFTIFGSDISPRAIKIAQDNIKSAGFSKYIDLQVMPFQQYSETSVPTNCVMVMNPPYGERISSRDILSLYEMIGTTLKHQFKGYDAWVLSYRQECFEKIGLKPSLKFELMNGGLDCEFRKYEIFSGKLKEFKSEGGEFSKEEKELELPEEGDFRQKRALRKERFASAKGGAKPKRGDKPGGFSKPGRRESTFKKFGDDRPRRSGDDREGSFRKFDGERPRRSGDDRERPSFRKFDSDRPRRSDDNGERPSFRKFDGERPRRSGDDRERSSFRKFDGERPRRSGDDRERSSFRKFDSDRPRRFGDDRESSFDRPRRSFDQSGNFRRNAEGKLEIRTDGEYKPRGERTFNPNRPMNIPGRDNDNTKNED